MNSITAAAAALVLAIVLQIGRDEWFPSGSAPSPGFLYIHSPSAVGRIVLGNDALAADVYWIRAIQHYGGERLRPDGAPKDYGLLYPLLDLTTSLDPYFSTAYRFGAIFLSEPYPRGPGRPDLAIALLRKGIRAQPRRWQYYHDAGLVLYWARRDPHGAASWFRDAAAQPGAPEWLLPVAAAMLTETTDRTSARYLWRQILESDEEWLRKRAARGLLQIDALDRIDELGTMVMSTPRARGEPYTWATLVRSGALRAVPVDPAGVPYELDPETGRVSVASRSPLFPMPDAMQRAQ